MPERPRSASQPITRTEAHAYATQAEEYLRAAETAATNGDYNAAAGTAVLAGINAGDAVSGFLQASRWSGPHDQAAQHLDAAGTDGKLVAKELRRLLPLKHQAQYEPRAVSKTRAEAAVAAARRAVAVARRVAELAP